MDYTTYLLLLLIALPGIFSDAFPSGKGELIAEEILSLQCEAYCSSSQRVCARPPFECGGCRPLFRDRDGECLPFTEDRSMGDDDEQGFNEEEGPDSDIDLMADRRAALDQQGQEDDEENNNVVNSVPVEPEGENAEIPPNATIERIAHGPGHSQDRKVHDVYQAAAAGDAEKEAADAAAAADVNARAVKEKEGNMADIYFLAVIAGCSIAGLIGLVVAGVCWYRLQRNVKAASEAEYPAYGVTGPVQEKPTSPGDRKLAQSAQMYHYQHQKQQMIAMEKANGDMTKDGSDADSEEENEEGDYTVYECPGLAPTGEMEVKNPLFTEETPVTPSEPSAHK